MATDNSTCDLKVQETLVATGLTMQFPDGKIVPLASMECPSEDIKKILDQVVSSSDSDSQGTSKGGGFRWNPICHAKVMRWFSMMGAIKGAGYVGVGGIAYVAVKELAARAGITESMSEDEIGEKTRVFLSSLAGAAMIGSVGNVLSTFTPINYRAYVELYEICAKAAGYGFFGGRKARKSRKYRKARKARKSRRY